LGSQGGTVEERRIFSRGGAENAEKEIEFYF